MLSPSHKSTYNFSLTLSLVDLPKPWDAYFNLLYYITRAPLRVRDYSPALTHVMSMFDGTASTVGMVTEGKLRRGFVCEIRDAMVFILFYGVWF